jgi:molecular chaperone HscB
MNIDDDDFTLFGLTEGFAVDTGMLDHRWRELQREVHPDRFASQGAAAQRVAMQWSVRINEAYRRLRDPLARAAYLCQRRGAPIDAERNTAMPRDFLAQQMAWREALDEAADAAALRDLADQVDTGQRQRLQRLQHLLDDQPDAAAAAAEVRALMFLQRLRREIEHRLEPHDA